MVLAKLLSLERGSTRHVTNKKTMKGKKKKLYPFKGHLFLRQRLRETEKIIKVTYTACSH